MVAKTAGGIKRREIKTNVMYKRWGQRACASQTRAVVSLQKWGLLVEGHGGSSSKRKRKKGRGKAAFVGFRGIASLVEESRWADTF